jgi:hypothetical protein
VKLRIHNNLGYANLAAFLEPALEDDAVEVLLMQVE